MLPYIFLLLFIAALAGAVYPFISDWKRWHFALAAFVCFIGLGATVPKPTPEELAAREAREARKAQATAATEARELRAEAAAKGVQQHQTVLKKAAAAVAVPAKYTRAEYRQTYTRVGAATFAKLNALEPGAAYAAAESGSCDRVSSAAVSEVSKPGAAVWFVDCANENRFMITQKEAEAALARFKAGRLALRTRERSCTLTSVADCRATPSQRASRAKETEYVTACDMLLRAFVVSPSSLDMHRWAFGYGEGDSVIVQRPFDSQNELGAMIRSRYTCTINAATDYVQGFVIDGPLGREKIVWKRQQGRPRGQTAPPSYHGRLSLRIIRSGRPV